jgi:prephenate dehydrogenase
MQRVVIVGTGLIGSSVGLALRAIDFPGTITGIDSNPEERTAAHKLGAVDKIVDDAASGMQALEAADVILLAVPVLAILDWMQRLAPILKPHQLLTDVGSTKSAIADLAATLYNAPGQPQFLPGHPMAGKESGGAAHAEARLLESALWLFTPLAAESALTREWRTWINRIGCRSMDMDPIRHDKICAWVSHLPQFVATAMAALFEDEFGDTKEVSAIGGRALREMTRLGASPYSMWRDVAMTNTDNVAATLYALEQRLAHLRENLRTPELRDEFQRANHFRTRR